MSNMRFIDEDGVIHHGYLWSTHKKERSITITTCDRFTVLSVLPRKPSEVRERVRLIEVDAPVTCLECLDDETWP